MTESEKTSTTPTSEVDEHKVKKSLENNAAEKNWPEPIVIHKARWLPSIVWLIPIVAALIGLLLIAKQFYEQGPTITISFKSAEGLEAGKTQVKFKDLAIGEVTALKLSENRADVIATINLTKEASNFAVKDTRFWIVRPRVAASGVSGLNTLLSGAYIGVDAGKLSEKKKEFVGLEIPPVVIGDQKGHQYVLQSESLGSLDIGSPIFYRRLQVGQVVGYQLEPNGKDVKLNIFVNAPYDQFVTNNTRFWHASGVDLRLDSSGLKLNTQSLAAVAIGGIAFQTPADEKMGALANNKTLFTLAANESEAMRAPDTQPLTVVLNFNQSLRGLTVGASVDFRGITVGEVTKINVLFDQKANRFMMPVTVNLYPGRLGHHFTEEIMGKNKAQLQRMAENLVKHGLRAQLRTGNLFTGQLYIAIDFFPSAKVAKFNASATPFTLPTIVNSLDQLQLQVSNIVTKLDRIPFDDIGQNLNQTLQNADKLFKQLDTHVAPEARKTLEEAQKTLNSAAKTYGEDSGLQTDARAALQSMTRAAQSISALTDYLERHPESLIRGKEKDKEKP